MKEGTRRPAPERGGGSSFSVAAAMLLASVALAGCGGAHQVGGRPPAVTAPATTSASPASESPSSLPSSPQPTSGVVATRRLSTPLEFRPVKSVRPGVCHAGTSNTIEDSSFSDCLIVAPSGLTVRRLKAVSYRLPSDGSPIIDLTFNAADGRTVAELTTRLAGLSPPRNDLAIMIGDPSDGQLVAAPAVMSAVTGDSIQLVLAGFDEAQARKVADQLAGH